MTSRQLRLRLGLSFQCFSPRFFVLLLNAWASSSSVEDWYTRYPVYPPYCSTPAEMDTRVIPQVQNDRRLGSNSRLIHTSVIIRHGARTPWTALDCWEGYQPVAWDCNLTTYLATPPPQRIEQEEGFVSPDGQSTTILFEKRYDALSDPGDPLSNVLNVRTASQSR